MVGENHTDLRALTFEEIVGTVNDCPWFAAAQKALCEGMRKLGGRELSRRQIADAALHAADRHKITDMLREDVSCPDADITALLEKYVGKARDEGEGAPEAGVQAPAEEDAGVQEPVNSAFRGVGDYFSREQYESVRRSGAGWPAGRLQDAPLHELEEPEEEDIEEFATETIAKIYEEQGYFDRAKEIYAKLILKYPEKNTYFASLIEKLNHR